MWPSWARSHRHLRVKRSVCVMYSDGQGVGGSVRGVTGDFVWHVGAHSPHETSDMLVADDDDGDALISCLTLARERGQLFSSPQRGLIT